MTATDKIVYADAFAAGLPAPKPKGGSPSRYNFGVGHNDRETIPVDGLSAAAVSVLAREGQSLAVYVLGGSPLGYAPLREMVADKLRRRRGLDVTSDEILITSGSMQGIDLVNELLLQRGDVVIVEQFSYVAVFARLRRRGVDIVAAPLDEGGIDTGRLGQILSELAAQGRRPKYIFTIPTIQNPTGTIMGLERRRQLIALAREHHVPIFEDECYADLLWGEDAPPSLYAMAPDLVIQIGSFSKTLSPALRLGYLVAPWQAMSQILALKTDGGTGALDQMVAAEFLKEHFDSHVARLSGMLREKLDVMMEAIDREFGSAVTVLRPDGGMYAWLRFPDGVDLRALTQPGNEAGVAFNVGCDWAVDPDEGQNHIRLCFGYPTKEEIKEGIEVLARICFETLGIPERSGNRANRNPV